MTWDDWHDIEGAQAKADRDDEERLHRRGLRLVRQPESLDEAMADLAAHNAPGPTETAETPVAAPSWPAPPQNPPQAPVERSHGLRLVLTDLLRSLDR